MAWHALHYPLREGTEAAVGDLFRTSGRPRFDVTDPSGRTVGRLLGTMAFVGAGKAVRVMEVDGPLPLVAAHMSRQPEVHEFERRLEEHLAVPRDMRTAEGARAFFQQAGMACVQASVVEQGKATEWTGQYYPVVPGHEAAFQELAAEDGRLDPVIRDEGGDQVGRVCGMLFFVGRGKGLRLVKVDGHPDVLAYHINRQPTARRLQSRIDEHLTSTFGGDDVHRAAERWAPDRLECVLSRRHDEDA